MTLEELLADTVLIPSTDCRLWSGALTKNGYGQLRRRGVTGRYAHREAYAAKHGWNPEGRVVMHSCDRPSCINPDHLVLGTQTDNMADMMAKRRHGNLRKTHCPRGHAFDEVNTRVDKGGRHRSCRACDRERSTQRRKAHKEHRK